jgi:hypothetical protein
MALQIDDGKGRGNVAGVTKGNRILVAAETASTAHFVSEIGGRAFSVISHDAGADAGDKILYFKNTDPDRDFFVDAIQVGAVQSVLWKVHVATGTASGGSTVTPTNLNLKSSVSASATVLGTSAITVTLGAQLATTRTAATHTAEISFDDILILGTGDAIAVEYDTGTTGIAEVYLRGYFQSVDEEI